MVMQECFRWYGPGDPVPLSFIRQTGATSVVTSLHHIPYGEEWSVDEIRRRQETVAAAGLEWNVVESLPVHEDIKTGTGRCAEYLANYRESLRNLASCGIKVVTYNFMPVLDWVRTDLHHVLPDGSEALYFNQAQFAAFELFILRRPGAEKDYSAQRISEAEDFYRSMTPSQVDAFTSSLVDNFPGFKGMTLDRVREMLSRYDGMTRDDLEANLRRFLEAVCPTAEEGDQVMVIHPDDPPYPILGLPRIFGTIDDIRKLLAVTDSPANGICFCSGSFSGRPDNDVVAMFRECASRVGFVHLRSTEHDGHGNFYEADHLGGVVDMCSLVKEISAEQFRRRDAGRSDWRLPFRPDHGHVIMDDLAKPPCPNPGYSALGRMKGLAEIRGLELGILRSCFEKEYGHVSR